MWNFLTFRKLITPTFIQIIMWIGVVTCLTVGIVLLVQGIITDYGNGGLMVLEGIFTILMGPLLCRVWAEKTTILFRMYNKLCGEAASEKPPTV